MKKIYLLLSLLVFTASCQKEPIENVPIEPENSQGELEKLKFRDLPKTVFELFTQDARFMEFEGRKGQSFGSVRKDLPVIKVTKNGKTSFTFALERKPGDEPSKNYIDNLVIFGSGKKLENTYVIRYESTEDTFKRSIGLLNFSGTVTIFSKKGVMLNKIFLKNGTMISKDARKKQTKSPCDMEFKKVAELCTDGGSIMGEGSLADFTCSPVYEFRVNCSSGGGGEGGTPTGPDTGSASGGGTSGGSGSDSGPTDISVMEGYTPPILPVAEDKIDDSQLKDCHSQIIAGLKTIKNGIMGKMIQKLAGSNSTDYNWKIDYNMPAGTNPDVTASTDPVATNFTITTHINLNRVQNSTDLSMARTFVHEAVHAFLAYQYRYDGNASDLNYTQSLNKYAAQYNTNANDTHHILYLKENLITPIANALQEMGTKLGYDLPATFYLDLAYGGLYNSSTTNTIFNNLVPDQDDRDRIKNRISAETDNRVVNGVSPAGKKAC